MSATLNILNPDKLKRILMVASNQSKSQTTGWDIGVWAAELVHPFFADFYETGKISAVICHGTCILLKTHLSNGSLLIEGKTWTGFADSEEDFADQIVGQKLQPFRIEEEAKKLPITTNYINGGQFKAFAVRDGNLITGQQQYSGAEAAKLVIAALGQ